MSSYLPNENSTNDANFGETSAVYGITWNIVDEMRMDSNSHDIKLCSAYISKNACPLNTNISQVLPWQHAL